jgi:SAM-dependent methyltransferase
LYGRPLQTVACGDCGLVFVSPRPGKPSIDKLYAEELYDRPNTNPAARQVHLPGKITFRNLYDDLAGALDEPLAGRRVLDIGADEGQWLALFDRRNDLVGLEPSSAALRSCREDIRLIRSSLEEATLAEPFDLVTATALIEHLYDPLQGLVKMNSFLKDGGTLFLYTPDVKHLSLRRGVAKYFKIVHLFYFSVETLSSLLHKAGFVVSGVKRVPPSFSAPFMFPQTGSSGSFWVIARKGGPVSYSEALRRPATTGPEEHDAVTLAIKQAVDRDRVFSMVSAALMHGTRWRHQASQGLRARFPRAWSQAKLLQHALRRAAKH